MRVFFDHNTRNIGFFEPVVYLKKEKLTGLRSFLWNAGEFADRMCYLGDSTTYIAEADPITYCQARIKPMSCYSLREQGGLKSLFFKIAKVAALVFLFPVLLVLKTFYKAFCVEEYLLVQGTLFESKSFQDTVKTKEEALRIIDGLYTFFDGFRDVSDEEEAGPFSFHAFKEWVGEGSYEECIGYLKLIQLNFVLSLSSSGRVGKDLLLKLPDPPYEDRILLERIANIAVQAWARILLDPEVLQPENLKRTLSPFSRLSLSLCLKSELLISEADPKKVRLIASRYGISLDGQAH